MSFMPWRKYDLKGSLSAFPTEIILQFLGFSKLSGILTIKSGNILATITIREGDIAWAMIDNHPKLGQKLVYSSVISKSQLKESIYVQKSDKPRLMLGNILVNKGFTSPEIIKVFIEKHIKDIVFKVLDLENGLFEFKVQVDQGNDLIHIEEKIERLILERYVMKDNSNNIQPAKN